METTRLYRRTVLLTGYVRYEHYTFTGDTVTAAYTEVWNLSETEIQHTYASVSDFSRVFGWETVEDIRSGLLGIGFATLSDPT